MKHQGRLKAWKDDRGFGFIAATEANKDIFLHISALPPGIRRPEVGDTIIYELQVQPGGKIRAINATIQGVETPTVQVIKPSKFVKTVPYRQTSVSSQKPAKRASGLPFLVGFAFVGGIIALISAVMFLEPRTATSPATNAQVSTPAEVPVANASPTPAATPEPPVQAKPQATNPTPANPTPANPPAVEPPVVEPPVVDTTLNDCNVKGNISISSGKRLYHMPGMRDYDITNISPEHGERWFCSEAEAVEHGWQRAPG
ncbi:cold shock domain-containing protein [Leptolyngbya sp. PCC 6406]|uniref:cold shock domain-containing protein n=1 Tax=Leptolyngbya sp. PCC 6406 TaxID=1173264 RepID=UPI0002ABCB02|nr:cold shock domain-containing protein [Leptolyngbya sp. PCC 6406]